MDTDIVSYMALSTCLPVCLSNFSCYFTVHICDPEKVFQAVVSHGCNRWYSLCLQMGSSSFEVDSITSGIPNRADKIRAVFNKKIDDIGERAATEALLQACRRIPHPIIGGVMDSLSKRIP